MARGSRRPPDELPRDPYSEAAAELSPSFAKPRHADTEGLVPLTPAQRTLRRRWEQEEAEAARLEPQWRERRKILLQDAAELGRFLDRYNAMPSRHAKARSDGPPAPLADRLLQRERRRRVSAEAVWQEVDAMGLRARVEAELAEAKR